MRSAAIGDAWRRLRKGNNRYIKNLRIVWSGVPRLSDGDLMITRPITLVCGENGAGKSTLLHLIYSALADEAEGRLDTYCRPHNGNIVEITLSVETGDQRDVVDVAGIANVQLLLRGTGDGSLVTLADPGMHIPALLTYIRGQANFDDLLEGVAPREFTEEELGRASFVVGRSYESVRVWEVEDSSFGSVVPYFSAEAHGVEYTSGDMGYGELSILYLVWLLSNVVEGSLFLIEEPEAFLSPRAQVALIDVIAEISGRRRLTIVMTSHSGAIATRLDMPEILYMTRASGHVDFHAPPRLTDLIDRLGLVPDRALVFFVEDQVAEILAKAIINSSSARLSGRGEFAGRSGEGGVRRAIEVIPAGLTKVSHIGILDGDQRALLDGADKRLVCLPGEVSPEEMLIGYSRLLDAQTLSRVFGVAVEDVNRAIAHAGGEDHHDWPYTMAANLNMAHGEVVRRIASDWVSANRGPVLAFVAELEAALG